MATDPSAHRGLVSVIIPTFNRASECRKAVLSALGQSYSHLEIIVIDDGSTDETGETLAEFKGRIRYFRQDNRGVQSALNHGLRVATGEFIAFLDSDDTWLPWKIEAQLEVLATFPHAGMVWTDMIAVDPDGNQINSSHMKKMFGAYRFFEPAEGFDHARRLGDVWTRCPSELADRHCYSGNVFSNMLLGSLVPTPTVLIRRARQHRVGFFDETLEQSGGDYDFHLRTSCIGPVAFMDVSSMQYRVGAPDQLTAPDLEVWTARNALTTVERALALHRTTVSLPERVIRERMAFLHGWVAKRELPRDTTTARDHICKSLRQIPLQPPMWAGYAMSFLPVALVRRLEHFIRWSVAAVRRPSAIAAAVRRPA